MPSQKLVASVLRVNYYIRSALINSQIKVKHIDFSLFYSHRISILYSWP